MRAHVAHTVVAVSLLLFVYPACRKAGKESDEAGARIADSAGASHRSSLASLDGGDSGRQAPTQPLSTPVAETAAGTQSDQSSQDASLLYIVVGRASLVVTDQAGRRSGSPPAGRGENDVIEEIPRSYVYLDAIDDDVTGEPDPGFTVSVGIPQPADTAYRIVMTSDKARTVTLSITAFSTDGGRQPSARHSVELQAGGNAEFRLRFSPSPGSAPRLERVAP